MRINAINNYQYDKKQNQNFEGVRMGTSSIAELSKAAEKNPQVKDVIDVLTDCVKRLNEMLNSVHPELKDKDFKIGAGLSKDGETISISTSEVDPLIGGGPGMSIPGILLKNLGEIAFSAESTFYNTLRVLGHTKPDEITQVAAKKVGETLAKQD